MLPKPLRNAVYDKLSKVTMRYVDVVPRRKAKGKTAELYRMISEDFFINGSLTCHSRIPDLMAGVWMGGRETMLVDDHLDHTTKQAMSGTLSQINICPYCSDMLVSLVHGAGTHQAATKIFDGQEEEVTDPKLRERLLWVKCVATGQTDNMPPVPFTEEELPEAIGNLHSISYINRVSHVIMDGSPVSAPFGMQGIKNAALKLFGFDLRATTERAIVPGRALSLLPSAPLPESLKWAAPNPRIADAFARWAAVIERESVKVISPAVREVVTKSLQAWKGEKMPMSSKWVDTEIEGLTGDDRNIAKLCLLVAKASYQVVDGLVELVLGEDKDQDRLLRVLTWASFTAATRIAERVAEVAHEAITAQRKGDLVLAA